MESANVFVKIKGKKYAIKQTQPDYSDPTKRLSLIGVSKSPKSDEILIWRFNDKFGALRAYPAKLKNNVFQEVNTVLEQPAVSARFYPVTEFSDPNIFHVWDFEVSSLYKKKYLGKTAQKILARLAYDKNRKFISFPGWPFRPRKEVKGFLKPSLFKVNEIEPGSFKHIGESAKVMRHTRKNPAWVPHFYYFGTKKAKQRVRRNHI